MCPVVVLVVSTPFCSASQSQNHTQQHHHKLFLFLPSFEHCCTLFFSYNFNILWKVEISFFRSRPFDSVKCKSWKILMTTFMYTFSFLLLWESEWLGVFESQSVGRVGGERKIKDKQIQCSLALCSHSLKIVHHARTTTNAIDPPAVDRRELLSKWTDAAWNYLQKQSSRDRMWYRCGWRKKKGTDMFLFFVDNKFLVKGLP